MFASNSVTYMPSVKMSYDGYPPQLPPQGQQQQVHQAQQQSNQQAQLQQQAQQQHIMMNLTNYMSMPYGPPTPMPSFDGSQFPFPSYSPFQTPHPPNRKRHLLNAAAVLAGNNGGDGENGGENDSKRAKNDENSSSDSLTSLSTPSLDQSYGSLPSMGTPSSLDMSSPAGMNYPPPWPGMPPFTGWPLLPPYTGAAYDNSFSDRCSTSSSFGPPLPGGNGVDLPQEAKGILINAGDEAIEFAGTPGRLALLNSNKKFPITLGEVKRRLSSPENLNVSLLGGIMRRAKNKNGGTELRKELLERGIEIPHGRRRNNENTTFTALCEAEAMKHAEDWGKLVQGDYPRELIHREVESEASRQRDDLFQLMRSCASPEAAPALFVQLGQRFVGMLANIMERDRSLAMQKHEPLDESRPPLPADLQALLCDFNSITHNFGGRAMTYSLKANGPME